VAFSPDGRIVLTGSWDSTAQLWDARSGKLLSSPLQHQAPVLAVAFNPDGRIVATGTGNDTDHFLDARSGKSLTPPLQHRAPVITVAFSPNRRIVATGIRLISRGSAWLWDTVTGKPLAPPLQHETPVLAVAFSPNGQTLATGAYDRIVRLWDAVTGRSLTNTPPLQGYPRTVAFFPNGKAFLVATNRWLNTYSWDGKRALPRSSQLLHGSWTKGFRFPSDCEGCIQVALGDTGNSFHLETLRLGEPADPPIKGDPRELLEKWKGRLGLKFDEQMKPVPAVDLLGEPEGARSPGARPR
jgi:WD40 repeat protein